MSFGRGRMLQSVRRQLEKDCNGPLYRIHMADYTNETIEKFCRELAENGTSGKEHSKRTGVDLSGGSDFRISKLEQNLAQFDDSSDMDEDGAKNSDSGMEQESLIYSHQFGDHKEKNRYLKSSHVHADGCDENQDKSETDVKEQKCCGPSGEWSYKLPVRTVMLSQSRIQKDLKVPTSTAAKWPDTLPTPPLMANPKVPLLDDELHLTGT